MAVHSLIIREMVEADCAVISGAFAEQGWNKPFSQYQAYLQECHAEQRVALIAEYEGQFAGYVTVIWVLDYPPFRAAQIPEIADFNVLLKYRRRGIGTALLDEAEKRIAARSTVAGIGVGLTEDYGPAHIMYIKRGYIPDGLGLFQQGRHLKYGDQAIVNDDLTLCFTKLL
jgi:GNAT superfamily N-acetyltransferase